ncbi:hypothetical protein [Actinacidiphila sp. ITFR-21]|uniref:hypothetical protein n=1 Tax=Actinacidiphila sp. ITFR-21 TaxID=3075199 RepID=UPI00288A215E|nr:hypothetical protein [Streptomyces sp. ITFR-21]WNI16930.1 hypothetical protein RLT57_16300 [Streptomyces sp. ITFR-21]
MSGGLFAWLGGHATPRDERASAARSRRHHCNARSADRAAQQWQQAERDRERGIRRR